MRHGRAMGDEHLWRPNNNNPRLAHLLLALRRNAALEGPGPFSGLTEQLSTMSLFKGDAQMKEAKLIALDTIETSL